VKLCYPFSQRQRVSQGWGENPAFYAPFGLAGHSGIDYAAPLGMPVLACHDGVVSILDQGSQYYGLQVRLMADGYFTLYGHLSDVVLPQGRTAQAGELIGRTGSTGNSTGPHLHLALSVDGVRVPGYGIWCDPASYIQEESMSTNSKLTWQFLNPTPWAADVVHTSGARYVGQLFYNGDEEDLFPQCRTIARCWAGGDGAEQDYINRGAEGAHSYYGLLRPVYSRLRKKVWAVKGPNEPKCDTPESRASLSAFYAEWADLMEEFWGPNFIVGNFATGTPDVNDLGAIRQLEAVWRCGGMLGVHQYGHPRLDSDPDWHALRHRRLFARIRECGWAVPKTVITECGYDNAGKGWRADNIPWSEYFRQWAWLDQQVRAEQDILCVEMYCSGAIDPKWGPFDLGESESRDLAAYMALNTGAPVVPQKPTLAEVRERLGAIADGLVSTQAALAEIMAILGKMA